MKMRVSFLSVSRRASRLHSFSAAGFQSVGLCNALAIGANAAEVRQGAGGGLQAVHSLGDHLREGILARAFGPGNDYSVRKAVKRQHLAYFDDDVFIPDKICKSHN